MTLGCGSLDGETGMQSQRFVWGLFVAALLVLLPGVALAGHAAFTDASGTHESGIHWLADTGITSGCGDGQYCPRDPVSRGQMATFMHRLAGHSNVPPVVNAATVEGKTAAELQGAQGPAGQDGIAGLALEFAEMSDVTDVLAVYVPCPADTFPLGGGGLVDRFNWYLSDSALWFDEAQDTIGWLVVFQSEGGVVEEVAGLAMVTCGEVPASSQSAFQQSSASDGTGLRDALDRYGTNRGRD